MEVVMKKNLLLFSLLSIICYCLTAQIIHVPADQPSIQEGINAATNGDTVLVDNGTYYENIKFIGKAITVASNFILDADTNHINNTIINGSQPSHPDSTACVMFINGEDTTSVLNGFTVTGGNGVLMTSPWQVQCGGGIFTYYSGSKIMNNKITYNHVEGDMAGGVGIASIGEDNWTVIDNNQIGHNSSEAFGFTSFGGGIAVTTNAIIKNNIIQYNTCNNQYQTADGGGIEVDAIPGYSPITYINNNIIQFNEINGIDYVWGAGISINNAESIITNNIIKSNTINGVSNIWGAGICIRIASGIIINNLINNNEANGNANSFGGGIYLDPPNISEIILNNNTLANNSSNTAGGGIYSISTSADLSNCILWNNSPDEIAGSFPVSYSNILGGWSTGEGNIDEDPLFVDSGDYPYQLQDGSPCVNTGNPDTIGMNLPAFDLAGNPRIYGGRIEMGAYENQNAVVSMNEEYIQNNFLLSIYPNPTIDRAIIEFNILNTGFAILSIKSISGKLHETIISKELTSGNHQFEWNAKGLPPGIYFLRLETNGITETRKLILLK